MSQDRKDQGFFFRFRAADYEDLQCSEEDVDVVGLLQQNQTFFQSRCELNKGLQLDVSPDGQFLAGLLRDRLLILQITSSSSSRSSSPISVPLSPNMKTKYKTRIMRWMHNSKVILVVDGLSQMLTLFSVGGENLAEIELSALGSPAHFDTSSNNPIVDVIPLTLSSTKYGFLLIHRDSLAQQVWLMDSEQELVVEVKPARQLLAKRRVENLLVLPKSRMVVFISAADNDDQILSDQNSRSFYVTAMRYSLEAGQGIVSPWETVGPELTLERGFTPINEKHSTNWYGGLQESIGSILSSNKMPKVPKNVFYPIRHLCASEDER